MYEIPDPQHGLAPEGLPLNPDSLPSSEPEPNARQDMSMTGPPIRPTEAAPESPVPVIGALERFMGHIGLRPQHLYETSETTALRDVSSVRDTILGYLNQHVSNPVAGEQALLPSPEQRAQRALTYYREHVQKLSPQELAALSARPGDVRELISLAVLVKSGVNLASLSVPAAMSDIEKRRLIRNIGDRRDAPPSLPEDFPSYAAVNISAELHDAVRQAAQNSVLSAAGISTRKWARMGRQRHGQALSEEAITIQTRINRLYDTLMDDAAVADQLVKSERYAQRLRERVVLEPSDRQTRRSWKWREARAQSTLALTDAEMQQVTRYSLLESPGVSQELSACTYVDGDQMHTISFFASYGQAEHAAEALPNGPQAMVGLYIRNRTAATQELHILPAGSRSANNILALCATLTVIDWMKAGKAEP